MWLQAESSLQAESGKCPLPALFGIAGGGGIAIGGGEGAKGEGGGGLCTSITLSAVLISNLHSLRIGAVEAYQHRGDPEWVHIAAKNQ